MPPPNATTTLDRSPPARDHPVRERFDFRKPLPVLTGRQEENLGLAIAQRAGEHTA